ncbi:MAG: hypothetical protein ABI850_16435 [Flavobacterium sp.]
MAYNLFKTKYPMLTRDIAFSGHELKDFKSQKMNILIDYKYRNFLSKSITKD